MINYLSLKKIFNLYKNINSIEKVLILIIEISFFVFINNLFFLFAHEWPNIHRLIYLVKHIYNLFLFIDIWFSLKSTMSESLIYVQ